MSRKSITYGYHLEVHVRNYFGSPMSPASYEARCHQMRQEILRHVNNVSHVDVIPEEDQVCEFCGRNWTEDSPTYNGGCCEEDESQKEIGA